MCCRLHAIDHLVHIMWYMLYTIHSCPHVLTCLPPCQPGSLLHCLWGQLLEFCAGFCPSVGFTVDPGSKARVHTCRRGLWLCPARLKGSCCCSWCCCCSCCWPLLARSCCCCSWCCWLLAGPAFGPGCPHCLGVQYWTPRPQSCP